MSLISELESLDDEVKELIQNYKHKKATAYEPCTLKNFRECLIGLNEVSTIKYITFSRQVPTYRKPIYVGT